MAFYRVSNGGRTLPLEFYLSEGTYGQVASIEFYPSFISSYKTIQWLDGGDSNCQVYFSTSADNYSTTTSLTRGGNAVVIPQGVYIRLNSIYSTIAKGRPRIRMNPEVVYPSDTFQPNTYSTILSIDAEFTIPFSVVATNTYDLSSLGTIIICPDTTKSMRLYCTYLGSTGGFGISYKQNNVWTYVGERANQNTDIPQGADMIKIVNSIGVRVQFWYI